LAIVRRPIRRVGQEQIDRPATDEALDVRLAGRVADEQSVAAELEEVARPSVDLGRRGQIRAGIEIAGCIQPGCGDQRRNIVYVVSGGLEVARGCLFGEDCGQEGIVVSAEVGGPIVGEHEGRRHCVIEFNDVRRYLGPVKGSGREEDMVPGHDPSGRLLDDDRLLLPEPAQAFRDGGNVAASRVPRMGLDAVDGHKKGLERWSDGWASILLR
jgi:hypothetical protein